MQEFLYDIVNKSLTDSNQIFLISSVAILAIIISTFLFTRSMTFYYMSSESQSSLVVASFGSCVLAALIAVNSFYIKSSASETILNKDLTNRIAITSRDDVRLDEARDLGLKIYDLAYDRLSKADLLFIDSSALDTEVFIVDRGNEVEIYHAKTGKSIKLDQSELDRYLKE